MIKLIVTDMDGTFLNDAKQMAEGTEQVLASLKEKDIRFVVASGRPYPGLEKYFLDHLEDMVFIAENGAIVIKNQEEVTSFPMKEEDVILCLDVLSEIPGAQPVICGKYCEYTSSPAVQAHFASPKMQYKMELVEDLYPYAKEAIKMFVVFPNEAAANAGGLVLEERLHKGLHYASSEKSIIDIGGAGVTKGAALAELQKEWKITPEETVVFGDQYNDKEMLELGYYSYVMEDCAEGLEQYARFRGGSNNEGFVIDEICRLVGLTRNGEVE